MKPLFLILKTPWFFLIASGHKTIEYRAATLYWHRRLRDRQILINMGRKQTVIFQHGYAADALRIEADIKRIKQADGFYEIHIANVREA